MGLKLEDKKLIVEELATVAKRSVSAIALDYRGMTVAQMTQLRVNARKVRVIIKVYRNTLARLAVEETSFACLQDALKGPIVLLFSEEDPGAPARLVRDFAKKEAKELQVRALALGGRLLGPDQLQAMANLPSREVALSLLMSVMLAPITKLARTLAEPYAELVRATAAIRDQKKTEL